MARPDRFQPGATTAYRQLGFPAVSFARHVKTSRGSTIPATRSTASRFYADPKCTCQRGAATTIATARQRRSCDGGGAPMINRRRPDTMRTKWIPSLAPSHAPLLARAWGPASTICWWATSPASCCLACKSMTTCLALQRSTPGTGVVAPFVNLPRAPVTAGPFKSGLSSRTRTRSRSAAPGWQGATTEDTGRI